MKTTRFITFLVLLTSAPAAAQSFDSGSDGSDGAITFSGSTANMTYPLPPDGVIHATTFDVPSGIIVRFIPNAANTPVYLLATGDVTINGTLDLTGGNGTAAAGGEPGPGGYRGGEPGFGGLSGGAGLGPGGGEPENSATGNAAFVDCTADHDGSYSSNLVGVDRPYGTSLLTPINGGSGGGGLGFSIQRGGGGGGGAILIASNTRIVVEGRVDTSGGFAFGFNCRGSGGDIRLVAPRVEGGGLLTGTSNGFQAGGRYRVDTYDRSALAALVGRQPNLIVGSYMVARPPVPTLDITEVDGTSTASVLSNGIAYFLFPFNTATRRTVRVTPSGFSAPVMVELVATPDDGTATRLTQSFNPATQTFLDFTVDFPVNVQTDVAAYVY